VQSYVGEVAQGVHRFDDGVVNWYLVEDGDRLALVDAGFPGDWNGLEAGLRSLDRSPSDLAAIVLTHAHVDHLGFAERARRELGAEILCHAAEKRLASSPTTIAKSERSPLRYLGHGPTRKLFLRATVARAPLAKGVGKLTTFADGETLEWIPGRPTAVHTPGHTDGHTAFLLSDRGVLFAGDAIVTRDPYTGRPGPCLVAKAATKSSSAALASLDTIAAVEADVILTGHGDPWHGTAAEAAERARAAGVV
jgi:glyoxylase-like metal-dependent hydrolase (beta-lactamase superfamily II)